MAVTTYDKHQNFVIGRVLTIPSPAVSGTSLVLNTDEGDRFPDPATYGAYNATVFPTGIMPSPDNAEIVRITAKSSDTLTITRATESSTARTIQAGDTIIGSLTSKSLTDIEAAIAVLEGIIDPDDEDITIDGDLSVGGDATITGDVTSAGVKLVKPYVVVATAEPADYVCDGTADDVQIQEALDAVRVLGGGTVFIKAGTYSIISKLLVYSDTTLCGEGWSTIIKITSGVGCAAIQSGEYGSKIVFKDLAVDGNDTGNPTMTAIPLVSIHQCTDSTIDNVYVHDQACPADNALAVSNVAIYGARCTNLTIKNCFIDSVGDYGIDTNGCSNSKIINNYVKDPANHGIAVLHGVYGTAYERATGNIVSGNIIYNSTGRGASGASCDGIKLIKMDDSIVSNNIIIWYGDALPGYLGIFSTYDPEADAIAASSNWMSNNTISDNYIYGPTIGIGLAGTYKTTISDNNIFSYSNVGASCGAIRLSTETTGNLVPTISNHCIIKGNYCEGETETIAGLAAGIELLHNVTDCQILENNIYNYQSWGIYTRSNANRTQIIGNTITGCGKNGIYIFGEGTGTNCIVTNNILYNNCLINQYTYAEITLGASSTYCNISNNIMDGLPGHYPTYGVRELASCDYNIVTNNTIKSMSSGAVLLVGTNDEIGHNIGY